MKKIKTLVTVVFLLIAAVIGWFLPIVDFDAYDKFAEGKQKDLDIKQINLSYREDLALDQKINIVVNRDENYNGAVELDRGIYLTSTDVEEIASDFLTEFTGRFYDESYDWNAIPMLISLEGNRGTIVVWSVHLYINEWNFDCFIDDKTGALLGCDFCSDGEPDWGKLIQGYSYSQETYNVICGKFCTALYTHYVSRNNAKLVTYDLIYIDPQDEEYEYLFVFKDEKNYTFQLNVRFCISSGVIVTE